MNCDTSSLLGEMRVKINAGMIAFCLASIEVCQSSCQLTNNTPLFRGAAISAKEEDDANGIRPLQSKR